jgi:hypothetical protein
MAPLPTTSRIFADRYRRDLKKREAAISDRIAPGTKTWGDALYAFFDRIDKAGSPIKRAAMIKRLSVYLNDNVGEGTHFILDQGGQHRSAGVLFATLSAGVHPLVGVEEEGVNIAHHYVMSRRNGAISASSGTDIAFISRHAIGRLHERGHSLTDNKASCVLACVGILGLLTRGSSKHVNGGLCLQYDDTLIVGSLKHALQRVGDDGRKVNGTVYDVRTALLTEEVNSQAMREQGIHATIAVAKWLDNRGIGRENEALAESIPYMPRREDYASQNATIDQKET